MKPTSKNFYAFELQNGSCKGFFNIYQARSGEIQIMMGNSVVSLGKFQAEALLGSTLYELKDFDIDQYTKYYSIK